MDATSADTAGEGPRGPSLSPLDQQVLSFERQWWKYAGSKEQAIRERFSISATRYYQLLNALLDRPEALSFDPVLVGRLRRVRRTRRQGRTSGRAENAG
jgi:hypothetical protein